MDILIRGAKGRSGMRAASINAAFGMVALLAAMCGAFAQEPKDNIAGPYVPTPWPIVDELLKIADIRKDDVVYDLGSGDGRLVITAAKRFGARGVGVELQSTLVDIARLQAKHEGVDDKVSFQQGDLFETSVSAASVVTLYLLPRFVTRLVPKLRAELAPGSRVISHDYALSPWPPDKTLSFEVPEKEPISGTTRTVLYYYVVPARVNGSWELSIPKTIVSTPYSLRIVQEPDRLEGVAIAGKTELAMRDLSVRGEAIRFQLFDRGRFMYFEGKVSGNVISGQVRSDGKREDWSGRFVTTGSR